MYGALNHGQFVLTFKDKSNEFSDNHLNLYPEHKNVHKCKIQ